MGAITAIGKLLLKDKKGTVGIIKKIAPTLGQSKTLAYKLKTAYKRGASKGYAEAMKPKPKPKPEKTKHYYAPKDF